jgi:PII-like signaling protein
MIPQRGKLLRILIGEADRHDGRPLFEWIVRAARENGLAGCSVFRGLEGYGAKSVLHTARVLRLSSDLPIMIEIVDAEEKIESFVPIVDRVLQGGLVTVETVEVRYYRGGEE